MTDTKELIARSERVASELDDHNANLDRRARTCIRELVTTLKSVEQAITDPENQPSQFGTVTLTMYKSLTQQLADYEHEVTHAQLEAMNFKAERDALQAQLAAAPSMAADLAELLNALRDNTLTTDQRSAIYAELLAAAPQPKEPK